MTASPDPRLSIDPGLPPSRSGVEGATPLGAVNLLFRNLRLITLTVVGAVVLAVALTLIRGVNYVAESRFKPQSSNTAASRLSGLAVQFGVNLGATNNDESVDFYAELAQSNELLREVASTRFTFEASPGKKLSGNLVDLYHVKGKTAEEKLQSATAMLRHDVSAGPNAKAGLVTLRTVARWPALATLINRRLLDLINEFNVTKRRSSASLEKEFVEARLNASQAELRRAEENLQHFREQNRGMLLAPQLTLELGRLQREVELQNQVYLSLAQAYEQVRVEEVRNTPVVTVVDGPEHSAKRAGGSLPINILIGIIVGMLLGIAGALAREYVRRARIEDPATYAEFERLVLDRVRRLNPFRRSSVPLAEQKVTGQARQVR